jgi:hypothetical protein
MGADPIYDIDDTEDTTKPITGELHLEGHDFKYEIYLLPIIGDDQEKVEKELIKRMGNRMQKGKHCLDIDEEIVERNIENEDYSAIVFVENKNHDDVASGTLQYYDWCEQGKNQLWINDLCRLTTSKQSVSPIKALLKVFEIVAKKYTKRLSYIHLMVDNEDEEGSKVLIEIYKKYGFDILTKSKCAMDDPDNEYTLMRKQIKKRLRLTKKTKSSSKSKGGRKSKHRK